VVVVRIPRMRRKLDNHPFFLALMPRDLSPWASASTDRSNDFVTFSLALGLWLLLSSLSRQYQKIRIEY
jgi:hypothetical protein